MTFSHRAYIRVMETEVLAYWRLCVESQTRFRANPADPVLDDLRDEMEVLVDMTDWPRLKAAGLHCISLDNALRIAPVCAKAAALCVCFTVGGLKWLPMIEAVA